VIAVEAAALTEADLAMVVTGFNEEYTARGVAGSVGDRWQGTRLPKAAWREVFPLGEATAFESAGPLLPPGECDSLGPALVIPGLHIEAPAALLVTRSGGTFDDHDVITLEQLAGLAAVAKEHREAQERL